MQDGSLNDFRLPRERGDPVAFDQSHWIPAFAGTTESFVAVPSRYFLLAGPAPAS